MKTNGNIVKKIIRYFLLVNIGYSPTLMEFAMNGNKLNGPPLLLLPINESNINGERDKNRNLKSFFSVLVIP